MRQKEVRDRRNIEHMPKVLVVDDDQFVRVLLRETLAGLPSPPTVSEAADGAEAVRMAGDERPDLVLLDLLMPVMSGMEALPRIRAASPSSRIVVISSMDARGVVDQALSQGAVGFIAKPFHPDEVMSAVRKALARTE